MTKIVLGLAVINFIFFIYNIYTWLIPTLSVSFTSLTPIAVLGSILMIFVWLPVTIGALIFGFLMLD